MKRALATWLLCGSVLAGCGYNCQSTCFHVYDPSECGIVIPGVSSDEMTRECISECETALKQAGPMGGYDPRTQRNPLVNEQLENERQAAEWMDCINESECADLDPASGICHPI